MTTETVITLVQSLGFPIVMVGWFAWRMEKRMDRQHDQLTKLVTIVKVALAVNFDDEEGK